MLACKGILEVLQCAELLAVLTLIMFFSVLCKIAGFLAVRAGDLRSAQTCRGLFEVLLLSDVFQQ